MDPTCCPLASAYKPVVLPSPRAWANLWVWLNERMKMNLICRPDWPQTQRPASLCSGVLGLKVRRHCLAKKFLSMCIAYHQLLILVFFLSASIFTFMIACIALKLKKFFFPQL